MNNPTFQQVTLPRFDMARHLAADREWARQAAAKACAEEEQEQDDTCGACDGSGEGAYDGASCPCCRGRGYA